MSHKNKKSILNSKFGMLQVISESGQDKWGQFRWKCICDCGNITFCVGGNLRNGHTKSCGCQKQKSAIEASAKSEKRIKHGHARVKSGKRSSEYSTYYAMIQRCINPKNAAYKDYGGRGIKVCNRWKNGTLKKSGFECFINDMGNRPNKTLSIDRINNNGNYEKNNCRWVSRKIQQNNTRKQNNLTPIHKDVIMDRLKEI